MLSFSSHHEFYLYTQSIDMRKGIDGLCGLVTNELNANPIDGKVYIFFNNARDKVKLLVWDVDGYVLYLKRLERGRFEKTIQQVEGEKSYKIQYKHLVMLMSGISLLGIKQKHRYDLSA
jgi:transposase